MPNQWFEFKQFKISQDKTAMKVGTDSVLLGAWCNTEGINTALDIGTGTGVVALMIAQRTKNVWIDAVEIDPMAAEQAIENIQNSKFNVNVKKNDFLSFARNSLFKYDLIVSNPPYFENSKLSGNKQKDTARHNLNLNISDIFNESYNLLTSKGRLTLIYPYEKIDETIEIARSFGFYQGRLLIIKPTPNKKPHRFMAEFYKSKQDKNFENEIFIEYERHIYSEDYIFLTKDFYLDKESF